MTAQGTLGRRFPPDVPRLAGRTWEGDADAIVQKLLEYLSESVQGLPAKHVTTHLGGDDNAAGILDPTEVEFGNIADPGDPGEGLAPIRHVHPLGPELESLRDLAGLDDLLLDGANQLPVYDRLNNRLLELIFLELRKLLGG